MYKIKFHIFVIILGTLSLALSIYYGQYHYDGHHYGLIYDSADELTMGKKPYKEIFLLYGMVTTLIHSLSLKIFDNNIFSPFIITSIFFSISLIMTFYISKKFMSEKLSFFVTASIFFIHPMIEYPWSNYILFFFICLSFLLFYSKNNKLFYLSAIFLGTTILIREGIAFYVFIILIYLLFLSLFSNNKEFKEKYLKIKILNFFFITAIPFLILILYLYQSDLISFFLEYLRLPGIYFEMYDTNIIKLFLSLIKFLYVDSIKKIIIEPYIFLFGISFLINTIYCSNIIISIFKKKKIKTIDLEISIISLMSILLYGLSLNEINIFRLICGSSLGFILIFYLIDKLKDKILKKSLMYTFIFLSFAGFSLFEKNSSNNIFKLTSEIEKTRHSNLNNFKWSKFDDQTFFNLEESNRIFSNISSKCNLEYFVNLQRDVYYKILAKKYFKTFQVLPFYNSKDAILVKYFDKNFATNLQKSIKKKEVMIITDLHNQNYTKFGGKKIFFSGYKIYKKLPFTYMQKNKIILTPTECTK